ncbi:hypothetical protein Acr_25g0000170 [Actinidia rufa]|uniref:Uncharacterized protein n=1 Tax=Actinidia rufa TaxID=165716 RepID=A0A7J0GY08_9ERIC|nr:hypothetical protein Acr_25g0000170 [Actinidia rufa]
MAEYQGRLFVVKARCEEDELGGGLCYLRAGLGLFIARLRATEACSLGGDGARKAHFVEFNGRLALRRTHSMEASPWRGLIPRRDPLEGALSLDGRGSLLGGAYSVEGSSITMEPEFSKLIESAHYTVEPVMPTAIQPLLEGRGVEEEEKHLDDSSLVHHMEFV